MTELTHYIPIAPFTEKTARYLFKKLLYIVHFLHSNGYAHRDLRIENIFLD